MRVDTGCGDPPAWVTPSWATAAARAGHVRVNGDPAASPAARGRRAPRIEMADRVRRRAALAKRVSLPGRRTAYDDRITRASAQHPRRYVSREGQWAPDLKKEQTRTDRLRGYDSRALLTLFDEAAAASAVKEDESRRLRGDGTGSQSQRAYLSGVERVGYSL